MANPKGSPENLIPFVPGDPRINRKGRPKKLVSGLIEDLKKEGYSQVTQAQISQGFETLLNLEESKIKEIGNDPEQPMFIRIIAKRMTSDNGHEIIEKILDRAHGKARIAVDHTTDGKPINSVPIFKWADQTGEEAQDADPKP